jgi:hypothetical protein
MFGRYIRDVAQHRWLSIDFEKAKKSETGLLHVAGSQD